MNTEYKNSVRLLPEGNVREVSQGSEQERCSTSSTTHIATCVTMTTLPVRTFCDVVCEATAELRSAISGPEDIAARRGARPKTIASSKSMLSVNQSTTESG